MSGYISTGISNIQKIPSATIIKKISSVVTGLFTHFSENVIF